MVRLMQVIDKASGYFYGGLSGESDDVMEMMSDAVGADLQFDQYLFMSILGGGGLKITFQLMITLMTLMTDLPLVNFLLLSTYNILSLSKFFFD